MLAAHTSLLDPQTNMAVSAAVLAPPGTGPGRRPAPRGPCRASCKLTLSFRFPCILLSCAGRHRHTVTTRRRLASQDGAAAGAATGDAPQSSQDLTVFVQSLLQQMVRASHYEAPTPISCACPFALLIPMKHSVTNRSSSRDAVRCSRAAIAQHRSAGMRHHELRAR